MEHYDLLPLSPCPSVQDNQPDGFRGQRVDATQHRDAHLNMRPSDLLKELEMERVMLQRIHASYITQLSALQMEEAALCQLQIAVLENDPMDTQEDRSTAIQAQRDLLSDRDLPTGQPNSIDQMLQASLKMNDQVLQYLEEEVDGEES
eukprot:Ihof_evm7s54 gene=Ihof_evmTU7s54